MESRSRMRSGFSTAQRWRRWTTGSTNREIRFYAIGVANGLEVTVIYTDVSESERRIISAWRAERHERAAYWQSLG